MIADFSYKFQSSPPVINLTEEVTITATIENPGVWQKSFVLLPVAQKSGDFKVGFPVDVNYFNELTDTIRSELAIAAQRYQLIIEARVHTTADTDFGRIDDVFTQTLTGELTPATVTWNQELAKSQPGAIERSRLIYNPERLLGLSVSEARIVLPAATGIFSILFLYVLAVYVRLKPVEISPINEEARRAKKKYKGQIVDVSALPPIGADEKVIRFDSVGELVAAADTLLKLVLHLAKADKHTYCVIDGLIKVRICQ